jgi:DNA-binding CsgD family transcriptional regulator
MRSIKGAFSGGMLAAFACFAATTMAFSPNTSVFRSDNDTAFITYYIFGMFFATLGVACAAAALSRRSCERVAGHRVGAYRASAVFYACTTLMFGFFSVGWISSNQAAVVVGALAGATLVPVCIGWARLLRVLDFRGAILFSACACICSFALNTVLGYLPMAVRLVSFACAVGIGSCYPFFGERTYMSCSAAPHARSQSSQETSSNDQPNDGAAATRTSDVLTVLRLPVVGLLLYTFMMSIMRYQAFDLADGEYVAGGIAALLIMLLLFVRTDKPLNSLVYRVVAPFIGGVVIVLVSLPAEMGFQDAAVMTTYVFLSALAILALAEVIAMLHTGEFAARLVVGIALALGAAVSLAGLVWTKFLGGPQDSASLVCVLIAVYCAVMLVAFGWETWSSLNKPQGGTEGLQPSTHTRTTVPIPDSVSSRLTRRENEILVYLGRGHSMTYIAEKLFISESTVRTHVKHIYAKLDIHSREELFSLLDLENAAK